MTTLYVVNKNFDGEGESLIRGDIVDASDWRYLKNLISLRYLYPADAGSVVTRVERPLPAIENEVEVNDDGEEPARSKPIRRAKPKQESISV